MPVYILNLFSLNFKFLKDGVHEPHAGDIATTLVQTRPVHRGRWLVRGDLKRSMDIVWQQLRAEKRRENGEGEDRRPHTAGRRALTGTLP